MNDQTDSELLRSYAEHRLEPAFAELVRRHLDFVYSAAVRMVRDPHLAEDVTQGVFVALAKSAPQLKDRTTLSGWLHLTAQNIAAQTVRTIERRRTREQEAIIMNQLLSAQDETSWEQIAPHLDAALGELSESDREAVLLRYFRNHDFRTVGATLGISDDTAQKRVSRAVEQMREFFATRGVAVGAGGLVIVISANAVQAAPAGLAATISAAALVTGTALSTSAFIAATKTIAMTTLQKTVITAAFVAAAGTGIFEARQAANLRAQVETLQQSQTPLADQNLQLQKERDNATNRLAELIAENSQLKSNSNHNELLKLRGEVTRLQNEAAQSNDPIVKKALRWKANVEKMKQLFAEHPEQQIPEMKLLSNDYFFDLARDQNLESSNGIQSAFSSIRESAKNQFVTAASGALTKYLNANGNQFPADLSQLQQYFTPPVDDAMLQRWEIVSGSANPNPRMGDPVITERSAVDATVDSRWVIGTSGYGSTTWQSPDMVAAINLMKPVFQAYAADHNGLQPTDPSQLNSYLTTPEQQAAYQALMQKKTSNP